MDGGAMASIYACLINGESAFISLSDATNYTNHSKVVSNSIPDDDGCG